ncbi:MAG: DUF2304 domain-containing protein [Rickettsiales bacterium]|nr:DUF2304 domain-containing protein [Rickettsiales bacterium]
MIIQFILSGILMLTLFFALVRREKAPLIALVMMLLSCGGMVFVFFPSIAQVLATWVGISRGVDLITYLFMAIMLVVILDVYLRLQATLELLTAVVRHVSLLEGQKRE